MHLPFVCLFVRSFVQKDDLVEVDYHSSGNFYPGKIAAVKEMSPGAFLYDVLYDDGDTEDMVPRERIRKKGGMGPAQPQNEQQPSRTPTAAAAAAGGAFKVGDEVKRCRFVFRPSDKQWELLLSRAHAGSVSGLDGMSSCWCPG